MGNLEPLHVNCNDCGLYQTAHSYVKADIAPLSGGERLDILFVGDAPGVAEDKAGMPFVGNAGKFLRDAVEGFEGVKLGVTNALLCRLPEGRDASAKEIKQCRHFLEDTLTQTNPRVVVALGSVAQQALIPGRKMSVYQSRFNPVKLGDSTVVTTYHPSMHVSDRKDLVEEYENTFMMVGSILDGSFDRLRPDIRTVDEDTLETALAQATEGGTVTYQRFNGEMVTVRDLIFLDTEEDTTDDKDHPEYASFYMDGRRLLCCGFSTVPEKPTWVISPQYLVRFMPIFKRKRCVGTNVKHDFNSLTWFTGTNFAEVFDLDDIYLAHSSLDLGKYENGLEAMAMRYLKVPGWKNRLARAKTEAVNEIRLAEWKTQCSEVRALNRARKKAGDEAYPLPEAPLPATLGDISWEDLSDYNGHDVYYTMLLYPIIMALDLPDRYRSYLIPLTRLYIDIEQEGVPGSRGELVILERMMVNKIGELLESLRHQPEIRQIEAEKETSFILEGAGSEGMLFRLIELTGMVGPRTESGKYKVSKDVLEAAGKDNPDDPPEIRRCQALWRKVHKIREMQFALSKFVRPYQYHIARDGRMHPSFFIARTSIEGEEIGADTEGGAETSRASCRNPALHNVKKDKWIRRFIKAPDGWVFLEVDYSTQEVRVLAWRAQDQALIELCRFKDPYRATALEMWGSEQGYTTEAGVPKTGDYSRDWAKTGFLAKMYGQGRQAFAEKFKTSRRITDQFFDTFERRFDRIDPYQKRLKTRARRGEILETPFGARRSFTPVFDPLKGRKDYNDNEIINSDVQGPSADILHYAALETRFGKLAQDRSKFRIISLVHDAIWALVREDALIECAARQKYLMENPQLWLPVPFNVPLHVEMKWGYNMGELQELKLEA